MPLIATLEAAHAQLIGAIIDTDEIARCRPPEKPYIEVIGEPWDLGAVAKRDELPSRLNLMIERIIKGREAEIDGVSIAISAAVNTSLKAYLTHEGDIKVDLTTVVNSLPRTLRKGIPVTIGNRSTMAAWGEFQIGRRLEQLINQHRDYHDLLFITISGNLGGGIIIDGQPYLGSNSLAGEVGHLVIDPQSPQQCPACGQHGCASVLASGRALVGFIKDYAQANPGRLTEIIDMATERTPGDSSSGLGPEQWPDIGYEETFQIGREPIQVDARSILRAAARQSPVAMQAVEMMIGNLAKLIAQLTYIFDPQLVVFGGIACAYTGLDDRVAELLHNAELRSYAHGHHELLTSWIGDRAGLFGAALWNLDTTPEGGSNASGRWRIPTDPQAPSDAPITPIRRPDMASNE